MRPVNGNCVSVEDDLDAGTISLDDLATNRNKLALNFRPEECFGNEIDKDSGQHFFSACCS
jgi:hypothetical protein